MNLSVYLMFPLVFRDLTFFCFFLLIVLRRVDPSYERVAAKFVRDVASAMGGIDMIVCPCIDCRNIDRHSGSVVLDHLVTRAMEEGYKMWSDWYLHGDLNS